MNTFVVDLLVTAVRQQSWYRAHANTINAAVALLGSLLAFVATLQLAQDPRWASAVALAIQFVGVVAIRLTRNGLSLDQAPDLAAAQEPAPTGLPDAVWSDLVVADEGGRHRA